MKTGLVSKRLLGAIAIAIAVTFVVGFTANTFLLGTQSSKGLNKDGFVFSEDNVGVTLTHFGVIVLHANSPNIITNAGEDLISQQTSCGANTVVTSTATTTSTAATTTATSTITTKATTSVTCSLGGIYIAVSNSTATPLATDTTCSNELATYGLTRTIGTYSHTTGTNTQTITASFIYSTSAHTTTISKVCMFNALTGGTLFAESLLSPTATLSAIGDNLTIQWTFTH